VSFILHNFNYARTVDERNGVLCAWHFAGSVFSASGRRWHSMHLSSSQRPRNNIYWESRDKEPRFMRRPAIINYRADVTLSVSSIRRNDNIRVVQPPRAPWKGKFTKLREIRKNKRACWVHFRNVKKKNSNSFNYLQNQNGWIRCEFITWNYIVDLFKGQSGKK